MVEYIVEAISTLEWPANATAITDGKTSQKSRAIKAADSSEATSFLTSACSLRQMMLLNHVALSEGFGLSSIACAPSGIAAARLTLSIDNVPGRSQFGAYEYFSYVLVGTQPCP